MALPRKTSSEVYAQLNDSYLWEWKNSIITYSFPTSSTYMNGSRGEKTGLMPITTQQQTFMLAIQLWDNLIARSFVKVENTISDIEYAFSTSIDGYAHVNIGLSSTGTYSGSTWFKYPSDVVSTSPGQYGFNTILHETGHALGLDHMGNYNAGDGPVIPSCFQDTKIFTIMSYFGPNGPYQSSELQQADWVNLYGEYIEPQTPMLYDVFVIQQMYGASTTTRTGNTTYGFSSNISDVTSNIFDFNKNASPVLCIFDSSGTDTINLSGFSSDSKLFLASGELSSCNYMTNNISIAFNCIIENGITGSGNDYIYGNSADNNLSGGLGNDVLSGRLGNDTVDGGGGADSVYLLDVYSNYSFNYTKSKNLLVCSNSIQGIDYVYNVESYIFNDGTRSLENILSKATVTDEIAPTLTSYTPAKAANDVAPDTNLVLTFSENVKAGSGFINIYDSNGNLFEDVSLGDSRITFNQGIVSINPSKDLKYNTSYYVNYDIGVILDSAGNSASKIADTSTIRFTTMTYVYPDDYPFSQPGKINLDAGSTKGEIENIDDSDYFSVTLKADTSYQFDLISTNANLDPILKLYGTDGELLISNDDIEYDVNLNSKIIFTCDLEGTYLLSASDYSGNPGSYAISGLTLKDDYSLSASTTSGVVKVNQGKVNGNIDFSGDGDLFKVTLEAGVTYAFILNSDYGLSGPWLTLYDSELEYLETGYTYGDWNSSLIFFTPTKSGSHYLAAFDFETGIGAYDLIANTGTRIGTSQTDYLIGTAQKDTLSGGAGDDYIYGSGNADNMSGGLGDDHYFVDNKSDKLNEYASEGEDWVITSLTNFLLPKNIENLDFYGDGNFKGTGNELDNLIFGNDGNDTIAGGNGDDFLAGFEGSDRLTGGNGSDTFYFGSEGYNFLEEKNFGQDIISDFKLKDEDYLHFYGFGDVIDVVWSKSEGITKGSSFFYSQYDGFIYYDFNGDGNPFAIVQLLGKPYISDAAFFILE
jgi:serralysin